MRRKKRSRTIISLLLFIALFAGGLYWFINRDNADEAFRYGSDNELILIVDAGHGGDDSGAISPAGMYESDINLAIAERVDDLAAFFGVRTVMTRESDEIDYASASTIRERKSQDQQTRLALIKSTPNAVFLSIHQNYYPEPGPFGAQALYAPTNGSEEFGKSLQELLLAHLNPQNRRGAERIAGTILLMNNIECPAVLIECAFLSNPEEEALLKTDAYKTKIAAVLTAGYLQNREALEAVYGFEEAA